MSTNRYGLSTMNEDFEFLGITTPREGGSRVPESIRLMESKIARSHTGGSTRSRVLSRMSALTEGRPAPQRQPQRQPQPAGRPSANARSRIQESLRAFGARVAVRTSPAGIRGSSSSRTAELAEQVHRLVGELTTINLTESVKAWANVALIAEMLGTRFQIIGNRLHEAKLVGVGQQMGTLANKSASIAHTLKESRNTASVPNLAAKFGQAAAYVIAGTQLYAGLTEGADAPFPLPAPGGQNPGMGGGMGQGQATEGDPMGMGDPRGMGGATPTQGVEGMGGMGGMGMEGDDGMGGDPLALGTGPQVPGMGAPGKPQQGEAMDDDDRVPFYRGANDPDLDDDQMLEAGDDPLGIGGDQDPLGT